MRKDAQASGRRRDHELMLTAFGPEVADTLDRVSAFDATHLRDLAVLYTLGTSQALFP